MTALIDTGVLLAVLAQNDYLHDVCTLSLEEEEDPLLPSIILPELAYMVARDIGHLTWIRFLESVLAGELPLIFTTQADLKRAVKVMRDYADSRVDFVDCVIMAMAERIDVKRVLTVDRKHFSLFRPKHCEFFEISP
ncbi:MAG: PIN domain-containing protein [Chloroflexi bacterium]|jgi:predicted nucleic acid-binding protein|nr:PIN domain-containing protein [Chloroflexota bacterium]